MHQVCRVAGYPKTRYRRNLYEEGGEGEGYMSVKTAKPSENSLGWNTYVKFQVCCCNDQFVFVVECEKETHTIT